MRPRFWPWTVAFVVTRVGDLWSTSLWMLDPGGEQDEMNPLSSWFGLSFWPVTLVNIALSIAILYGHWQYTRQQKATTFNVIPDNWRSFLSMRYTGRPDQYARLVAGRCVHGRLPWSFIAHGLIKAISLVGVLVVLHNLGQYHQWHLNDRMREIFIRPAFVLYALAGAAIAGFHWQVGQRAYKAWLLHKGD